MTYVAILGVTLVLGSLLTIAINLALSPKDAAADEPQDSDF